MVKYLPSIHLLLLISGLLATSWAEASSGKPVGPIKQHALILSGPMVPGTYQRFRAFLENGDPQFVVLDGPGGQLIEAVLIGTEIRRRGLSTVVRANRSCASACAVAYLAGKQKYAGSGAAIGLHPASNRSGHFDASATELMFAYLRDMGVPAGLLQAKLSPATIWWLSGSDRRALKISSF
jgi:hypothetical protein